MGLTGVAFSSAGPPCLTPGFWPCCLQAGVRDPSRFRRAVGCAGSCFHTRTFGFKIHFCPESLLCITRPLAIEFQVALKAAVTDPPGLFLRSPQAPSPTAWRFIPQCSVFREKTRAGELHGQCHPAGVGAAPSAPSSPFNALAVPPTAPHCCCDLLKGTDRAPSNSSYSFKTTLLLYLCIYYQGPRAADQP